MLIRLIYASQSTELIKSETIRSILKSSQANNTASDLTGILCHARDKFLQVLEGERSEVNKAYARIARDPRHAQIVLLSYEYAAARLYPEWTMDYVSADEPENIKIIKETTGRDDFLPETFSSTEAVNLTKALRDRRTPQIGLE